jgi:N-methylhydantoinase A/oxoprolinase/acetone carboxylase beta subunit
MGHVYEELSLGIDTGGTFTDAVLWDRSTQQVLASAKAFTTYEDLSIGILEAVRKVLTAWKDRCAEPRP